MRDDDDDDDDPEHDGGRTLRDVACALGVDRETVRQTHLRALRKLKFAIAIDDVLGARRSVPILDQPRGQKLAAFEAAALDVAERRALGPRFHALRRSRQRRAG